MDLSRTKPSPNFMDNTAGRLMPMMVAPRTPALSYLDQAAVMARMMQDPNYIAELRARRTQSLDQMWQRGRGTGDLLLSE